MIFWKAKNKQEKKTLGIKNLSPEKNKVLKRGAEDFAIRFEKVMKELSNG